MTLRIIHKLRSTLMDDPVSSANGDITPSAWNADHDVGGTVPLAQIDMLPAGTVLGNPTNGLAPPTVVTGSQLAAFIGSDPTTISQLQQQIADLMDRISALEAAMGNGI